MSIDPTRNNSINHVSTNKTDAPQTTPRGGQSEATDRGDAAGSARGDTTRLSRIDTSDASHDIDTARVAEIRQGIADGTLTFDTGRIADGIIASARELAGDDPT